MIGIGNGAAGAAHREPAVAEMAAFDALPREVRVVMNEAARKYSAIDALAILRQGRPPGQVVAAMVRQDAA